MGHAADESATVIETHGVFHDSGAKIQIVAVVTQEKTVWPAVGVVTDAGDIFCVVDCIQPEITMVPIWNVQLTRDPLARVDEYGRIHANHARAIDRISFLS